MDNIRELLRKVEQVTPEKLPRQETLPKFNVFRLCGVDHYETVHSRILAEFLNPRGSHGYEETPLEMFFERIGHYLDDFGYSDARVFTEYTVNDGRIDVLIEDERGKKAYIIENKIYASDQSEQLKRYDEFAKAKYGTGNYTVIYLTLYGEKASAQSSDGVDYITISYRDDILGWINYLERNCRENNDPYVAHIFEHYANHIKQLTINGMDAKEKQKIADMITADPALMENANRIYEAWWYCKSNAISKLVDAINKVAEEFDLQCEMDTDFRIGKRGTAARLFEGNWDFVILFYFEGDQESLKFGIDHCNGENEYVGEKVDKLRALFSGAKDFDVARSRWIVYNDLTEWNSERWASLVDEDKLRAIVNNKVIMALELLSGGGF